MESIYNHADLSTDEGLLDFYRKIIDYRDLHKTDSEAIARFAFDVTYEASTRRATVEGVKKIRYEFGALEAPGWPDDVVQEYEYVDSLWERLAVLVDNARNEKRTV